MEPNTAESESPVSQTPSRHSPVSPARLPVSVKKIQTEQLDMSPGTHTVRVQSSGGLCQSARTLTERL